MEDCITAFGLAIAIRLTCWLAPLAWTKLRRCVMHPGQAKDFLSVGQVAEKLGINSVQVGRLYERGFLPAAPRVGMRRIIPVEDLPKLKEAAKQAGYLK